MRDGTCPKCNATTVHVKRKGISFGERGVYVLTAEWVSKPLPLDHYICTTCGYFESYVVDKAKLDAVAREWTKVADQSPREKGDGNRDLD
jgi:hypothetical protein